MQFHGNAENQSSHLLSVSWLVDYGYDVITFDYRGFGQSSGSGSFSKLKEDAKIIYDYVLQTKKADQQLILVGQSLGGYVLLQTLADSPIEKKVDWLILDSTFSSIKEMLKSKSKILGWFSPSEDEIKKPIITNILITHGTQDPVIPFSNGEKLSQLFPKSLWWKIQDGRHLDIFTAHDYKYRSELLKILGNPQIYQVQKYLLNPMEKTYLKSLVAKPELSVGLKEQLESYKKDFISHPAAKNIPQDCSPNCLCPLYAELFKRLGSKKLSQSMYRQNLSNQDEVDKKCLTEAETFSIQEN